MKPGVKIFLGIFTSLATIGFILLYDFVIKERIDTTEVVVVKAGEEILKSETIPENKLAIERRAKNSLVEGVVLAKDIDSVIGKDAKQDIMGNSMISTKMIDYDRLVPDVSKGEAIRPITADMIYAQPGSLRRKDIIDIYLVYPDGTTNLDQNGPNVVHSNETEQEPNDSEEVEQSESNQEVEQTIAGLKPFLENIRVVYVKDSSNQEVVSPDGESNKRLNATSTISDIEVILNEQDFSKLMDEVLSQGAQLYITYQ